MGGKDADGRTTRREGLVPEIRRRLRVQVARQDPDIIAAQKKAGYDLDVLRQQVGTAQSRENITATWYNEWDRFTQQQIQNTLLRQIKPQEALAASAEQGARTEEERVTAMLHVDRKGDGARRRLRPRVLPIVGLLGAEP